MTARVQMMFRTTMFLAIIWLSFGLARILGTDQVSPGERIALVALLLIPAGFTFAAWWFAHRGHDSNGKTIL